MTDEIKLQREINRGNRAKALIEDDMLAEAFATLEKQLMDAWLATGPRDAEGREIAFRMIHAQRKLRDWLQNVIANGKVADTDLKMFAEREAHRKRHAR